MTKEEKELEKQKEEERKKIVEEAKAELKAEGIKATKKVIEEKTKEIEKLRKNKSKTQEEKQRMMKLMQERAITNASLPRNLNELYPSQMTLEEMTKYCKDNSIEVKDGDSTIMLRTRIAAFRDPAQAERVQTLENQKTFGKIVR